MLTEGKVEAEILKLCREELGRDIPDLKVEERDYLFWVQMGDHHARIERRHIADYMRGDRNGTGKAGILMALLNSRRK
jgi:hypothetical protein